MAITIARIPRAIEAIASIILSFGADMLAVANYPRVNGDSLTLMRGALDSVSQATCSIDGAIRRLSWDTELGDATTVMKIVIDGSVEATITLSGATGVSSYLNVPILAGQEVALEYDAGTAPGNSNFQLTVMA